MKKLLLMLTLILVACSSTAKKGDGPVAGSEFKIRDYETQVLPNGLTVMWIPDSSLPYVSMQMMIKAGSSQDPVGKEGLASFTAGMLDQGTSGRTSLEISEDLEQIGSDFGIEVQPDYTIASISSLSFHKNKTLELFREILLRPSFPVKEIERQRKIRTAGLQKLADRPNDFSEYLFPRFLYGSHPYGHEVAGTPKAIKNLNKTDIQNFYSRHFTPGNAVLAVVGQYDEAWKKKLVTDLGSWKSKAARTIEIPDFPQWKGLEVLLVDRNDLNQAQIQIGFKGVPRAIPEYLELRAALKILGESFGSRLFEEIREKRGLTYHIRAWFDPRLKPGPMGIYTFTRTDKIGETIQETLNTYRNFVSEGVSDKEVQDTKNLMRGQFPRMFETPESLARQLLILGRYGVSPDYLTQYLQNLNGITTDSVNATVRKYFDSQNLKILVYAPKEKAEAELRKLGKLEIKGYKDFLQ